MSTTYPSREHPWDVTSEEAKAIQSQLAPLVTETPLTGPICTVAGIDVSFPTNDVAHPTIGCAKSRLIGTHHIPGEEKGSSTWLYDPNKFETPANPVILADSADPVGRSTSDMDARAAVGGTL